MTIITEPVVHYVPGRFPQECRNAIITEGTGDKLGLAVFDPEGARFKRGVYHAPPPDAGGGTWHHLAECVSAQSLRDKITVTLAAGPPLGMTIRQLAEVTGEDRLGPVSTEMAAMLDAGLTRANQAPRGGTRYFLTGPLAPAGKLPWHEGTHAWEEHDGYPRHQHSLNGCLTIAPDDGQLHFAHGPGFGERS